MIKIFCDRCGEQVDTKDVCKDPVGSMNSLVVDTINTHEEKDLCNRCMKSFESWLKNEPIDYVVTTTHKHQLQECQIVSAVPRTETGLL